jgi:hypothetical protein
VLASTNSPTSTGCMLASTNSPTSQGHMERKFKLYCDRRSVGVGPPDFYNCRTFAVFMLWGALFDERTGL